MTDDKLIEFIENFLTYGRFYVINYIFHRKVVCVLLKIRLKIKLDDAA